MMAEKRNNTDNEQDKSGRGIHGKGQKHQGRGKQHQENHITCGACGTTLLIQTTLSHTPTNNDGDIIPVVAGESPQTPQIHHNFVMGPQTRLVNYCTTLASPNIKIIFFVLLYYVQKEHINTNVETNLTT